MVILPVAGADEDLFEFFCCVVHADIVSYPWMFVKILLDGRILAWYPLRMMYDGLKEIKK